MITKLCFLIIWSELFFFPPFFLNSKSLLSEHSRGIRKQGGDCIVNWGAHALLKTANKLVEG